MPPEDVWRLPPGVVMHDDLPPHLRPGYRPPTPPPGPDEPVYEVPLTLRPRRIDVDPTVDLVATRRPRNQRLEDDEGWIDELDDEEAEAPPPSPPAIVAAPAPPPLVDEAENRRMPPVGNLDAQQGAEGAAALPAEADDLFLFEDIDGLLGAIGLRGPYVRPVAYNRSAMISPVAESMASCRARASSSCCSSSFRCPLSPGRTPSVDWVWRCVYPRNTLSQM
jgi:hypothetical protein